LISLERILIGYSIFFKTKKNPPPKITHTATIKLITVMRCGVNQLALLGMVPAAGVVVTSGIEVAVSGKIIVTLGNPNVGIAKTASLGVGVFSSTIGLAGGFVG